MKRELCELFQVDFWIIFVIILEGKGNYKLSIVYWLLIAQVLDDHNDHDNADRLTQV